MFFVLPLNLGLCLLHLQTAASDCSYSLIIDRFPCQQDAVVQAAPLLPVVEQVACWGERLRQPYASRQMLISGQARHLQNYSMAHFDGSQSLTCFLLL